MGEKGEQLGVIPLYQALETARSQGLDLVEVAATSVPPVCRILDYGKFRYAQERKERELRKTQKITLLREIRIRPKIGDRVFGCDACLEACPWNRFAKLSTWTPRALPPLTEMLSWTERQFTDCFRGTPVYRLKLARLLRNIRVALGNLRYWVCTIPDSLGAVA